MITYVTMSESLKGLTELSFQLKRERINLVLTLNASDETERPDLEAEIKAMDAYMELFHKRLNKILNQ